jgi:hypothetical protein
MDYLDWLANAWSWATSTCSSSTYVATRRSSWPPASSVVSLTEIAGGARQPERRELMQAAWQRATVRGHRARASSANALVRSGAPCWLSESREERRNMEGCPSQRDVRS